jgi:hypothetical protein
MVVVVFGVLFGSVLVAVMRLGVEVRRLISNVACTLGVVTLAPFSVGVVWLPVACCGVGVLRLFSLAGNEVEVWLPVAWLLVVLALVPRTMELGLALDSALPACAELEGAFDVGRLVVLDMVPDWRLVRCVALGFGWGGGLAVVPVVAFEPV